MSAPLNPGKRDRTSYLPSVTAATHPAVTDYRENLAAQSIVVAVRANSSGRDLVLHPRKDAP